VCACMRACVCDLSQLIKLDNSYHTVKTANNTVINYTVTAGANEL